jgi:hypothetical protein
MKLKKLEAELDYGEVDDLMELIHHKIVEHRELSNLRFVMGEITKERHEWNLGHSEYWENIFKKIKIS